MRHLLERARLWWTAFRKGVGRFFDVFRPQGVVELTLRYAGGPRKGEVYLRRRASYNVVTSWLSVNGAAPTSGRDMMRRILVPTIFSGSLASDTDAVIKQIQLGSGVTAETTGDTALVAPISGSEKDISSVEFDASNPYVTFIVEYDESEVNQTISEAALLSGRAGGPDFIARKTFGSFTKTNEFTLQIRWQIRF